MTRSRCLARRLVRPGLCLVAAEFRCRSPLGVDEGLGDGVEEDTGGWCESSRADAREGVDLLILLPVDPLDGVACEAASQLVYCLTVCCHGGGDCVAGAGDLSGDEVGISVAAQAIDVHL